MDEKLKNITETEEEKEMDVVVSFDTTGSMFPVLSQVRREVESFVNTMFSEFSDLRIGIIAHGDYCDADDPYTIIYRELSRDSVGLCKFVRSVKRTYGGDADECYELVLNLAHSDAMGWREDADKILIMIGDASPHSPSYRDNKDNLNWVEETEKIRQKGIKIFGVHALASMRSSSRGFYKRISEETLGVYLTLDQFSDIVDLIKATVYQQSGEEKLSEFITIIKDRGKMTRTMSNNFKRLKGEEVPYDDDYAYIRHSSRVTRTHREGCEVTLKEMGALVPVVPGRFQIMTVDENCDIKGFVTKNGIEFKKGRGFYELTKAETVQQYKEIIIQDRETGEMFNGSQVREKLKLQPQSEKGGVNEKLYAADAKEFRIFVQSTSVNRKLIAGTTFLYEIPDMEDTGTVICDEKLPTVVEDTVKEIKDKAIEEPKAEPKADEPKAEPKADEPKAEPKAKRKKTTAKKKVEKPKAEKPKVNVEDIEFSEFKSEAEVLSAPNKAIEDMLKGESNWLKDKLDGKEYDTSKEIEESKEEELDTSDVNTEEEPLTDKPEEEKSSTVEESVTEEQKEEAREDIKKQLCKYLRESREHIESVKHEMTNLVDEYINKELNVLQDYKISSAYKAEDRVDKVLQILKAVLT